MSVVVDADFFRPEVVRDPYPMLEELRAAGPVLFHEGMGVWLILDFDDIKWCNTRHEIFQFPPEWQIRTFGSNVMQGYDTPRHDELRGVWAADFHLRTVREYEAYVADAVAAVVDPFADRVRAGETVEFVDAVARHIPTAVITWLLGVSKDRVDDYAHWSEEMAKLPQAMIDPDPQRRDRLLAEAETATNEMLEALHEEVGRRQGEITDDLIGRAANVPLTTQERVANLASMAFAGYGTTAKLLGHIMVVLAAYPDQRRLLVEDRSLIPGAVEEILRWAGIIMSTPRRTSEQVEVHGVTIPAGADVLMMYSTANRDPARWEDPGRIDVTRKRRQHLAMGFGFHHCLGQSLARLEARVFLDQMLDRLPEWEIDGDVDYGINFFIRGPLAVPVRA